GAGARSAGDGLARCARAPEGDLDAARPRPAARERASRAAPDRLLARVPRLPRVEGEMDERGLPALDGVDGGDRPRPALPRRAHREVGRDPAPAQLLQAASSRRLPANSLGSPRMGTTLVLGGGPAGLTAGYLLGKAERPVVVLEAQGQVGGLAKTIEIDGYRFDLGGHRFFTKSLEVETLWREI